MIRVLVVDDSAVVRKVLSAELSKQPGIEVVGSAMDPYAARDKIVELRPDVLTLDVEMPRMDGISFLEMLMAHHPIPVIMVSSLTPEGSDLAMRALSIGAVDVVPKPSSTLSVPDVSEHLARAVRAAAGARVSAGTAAAASTGATVRAPHLVTTHKILAIGASTGGTQAIEAVISQLPVDTPGTVITQHMPEHFTKSFAKRLDSVSAMDIHEASGNDAVVPGVALIAPGGRHMILQKSGARYYAKVKNGPPVHHQRPSVDVLFRSVARSAGPNAVGVILTGMGADGAKGMREMHDHGAKTIAQDENSCVVFGMPKEAVALGGVDQVLPLRKIPQALMDRLADAD